MAGRRNKTNHGMRIFLHLRPEDEEDDWDDDAYGN